MKATSIEFCVLTLLFFVKPWPSSAALKYQHVASFFRTAATICSASPAGTRGSFKPWNGPLVSDLKGLETLQQQQKHTPKSSPAPP
jgi:hypothetical protein